MSNTHSDPKPQRLSQTPMHTLCPKPAKDPTMKPPPKHTPPPDSTPKLHPGKNPDKKPLVVCHLPPRNHPMSFLTNPPPLTHNPDEGDNEGKLTRGNASGFWSLTVLPGGQGFLGRLGAPGDLFEFQVRGCSQGFLCGSFRRA